MVPSNMLPSNKKLKFTVAIYSCLYLAFCFHFHNVQPWSKCCHTLTVSLWFGPTGHSKPHFCDYVLCRLSGKYYWPEVCDTDRKIPLTSFPRYLISVSVSMTNSGSEHDYHSSEKRAHRISFTNKWLPTKRCWVKFEELFLPYYPVIITNVFTRCKIPLWSTFRGHEQKSKRRVGVTSSPC